MLVAGGFDGSRASYRSTMTASSEAGFERRQSAEITGLVVLTAHKAGGRSCQPFPTSPHIWKVTGVACVSSGVSVTVERLLQFLGRRDSGASQHLENKGLVECWQTHWQLHNDPNRPRVRSAERVLK